MSRTRPILKYNPRPRSARLAVWISLTVAVLLLGGIGGFNFYVDSAGVLSDQTSTGNVKDYIDALRRAPAGMPYTHYDRPAKLRLAATSTADCLVTGSSHMMTLRVDRNAIVQAECRALDNAGVSGASFEDLILMMGAALANANVKHVYIGLDIWSMSRNTSERWRKVTANFQAARQAFGLPEGLYETRGGASIGQRLRELFSLSYLRLNYRQLKRALRGDTALVYSTEPLTEADLRTELALRPDGSLSYPDEFEPSPSEADLVISDQWIVPPYFDPAVVDEMRRAVQGLQKAGKTVSFFIGPYHPAVFKCEKPRICEGIRVMDPLIRKLAAELGVPVIGGFDPGIFGYTGDSFLDFQHLRGTELYRLRILGPDEATRSLEHVPAD